MRMRINEVVAPLLMLAALLASPAAARAQADQAPTDAPALEPDWKKPFPIGFSLDYTLVSDYVWRGINLSEYAGEGREKPNHQLGVGVSLDTSDVLGPDSNFGEFAGCIWFEWYAAQQRLTPWTGTNLQEVDYTVSWSYEIAPIGTTVELGWIAYHFPPYRRSGSPSADAATTYEVYGKVSFDDSLIFGSPLLNPYVAYYLDVDVIRAGWLEFGVSHDFALADLGLGDVAVLKHITITPSAVLGVSDRYYDRAGVGSANGSGMRLGNINYGLELTYDLSSSLGLPAQYGSLTAGAFINYSQAVHDVGGSVNDILYGGMKLGYSW
jgi:hypothetical protein